MRDEFTSTETDSLPGQVREHCELECEQCVMSLPLRRRIRYLDKFVSIVIISL